jgi:hypothetical protein
MEENHANTALAFWMPEELAPHGHCYPLQRGNPSLLNYGQGQVVLHKNAERSSEMILDSEPMEGPLKTLLSSSSGVVPGGGRL